jgi:hypothetical protein
MEIGFEIPSTVLAGGKKACVFTGAVHSETIWLPLITGHMRTFRGA